MLLWYCISAREVIGYAAGVIAHTFTINRSKNYGMLIFESQPTGQSKSDDNCTFFKTTILGIQCNMLTDPWEG